MIEDETFPIEDAIDETILMHRDAHFGGNFGIMLDYYSRGGKGALPDIECERIALLAEEEKRLGHNLAADLLSARDAERIKGAKKAYERLRELYELKTIKTPFPLLIADLILSEEELPSKEIEAIITHKSAIVPFLIDLLKSEEMYDPLYPGYGHAPHLAAHCLGLIGDKRAIISLFESFGKGDFFDDDIILEALQAIGESAKSFLLKVLQGHPINEDNERAAIALIGFKDDPEVAKTCFSFLKSLDLKKEPSLATYLILACEKLPQETEKLEFEVFAKQPSIPKELHHDFNIIQKLWKSG